MIQNRQGVAAWWWETQPDLEKKRPGDRAGMAQLRRCSTVAEAMREPSTIALFRACGATHAGDLPAVALAAAVLAHVRRDVRLLRVARQIGPESPDRPETALLKPLRFRRLIEADSFDDRLASFRRMVEIIGGSLHVPDLSDALLDWTERRSQQWIFDYWIASTANTSANKEAAT